MAAVATARSARASSEREQHPAALVGGAGQRRRVDAEPELGAQADDRGRGHDAAGPAAAGRRAAPSRAALDAARRPSPGRAARPRPGVEGVDLPGLLGQLLTEAQVQLVQGERLQRVHGHRLGVVRRPVTWVPWSPSGPKDSMVGTSSAADAGHEDALAGLGGRGDEVGRAARHAAEVAGAGQRDEDDPLAEVAPQREPVDGHRATSSTSGRARPSPPPREAAGVRRGGPQREAHRGGKAGHAPIVGVAIRHGGPGVA